MSVLSSALRDDLALRRALGFKLRDAGSTLRRFVSFLDEQGASHITTDIALQWAVLPQRAQPAQGAQRLRMVRRFAV